MEAKSATVNIIYRQLAKWQKFMLKLYTFVYRVDRFAINSLASQTPCDKLSTHSLGQDTFDRSSSFGPLSCPVIQNAEVWAIGSAHKVADKFT